MLSYYYARSIVETRSCFQLPCARSPREPPNPPSRPPPPAPPPPYLSPPPRPAPSYRSRPPPPPPRDDDPSPRARPSSRSPGYRRRPLSAFARISSSVRAFLASGSTSSYSSAVSACGRGGRAGKEGEGGEGDSVSEGRGAQGEEGGSRERRKGRTAVHGGVLAKLERVGHPALVLRASERGRLLVSVFFVQLRRARQVGDRERERERARTSSSSSSSLRSIPCSLPSSPSFSSRSPPFLASGAALPASKSLLRNPSSALRTSSSSSPARRLPLVGGLAAVRRYFSRSSWRSEGPVRLGFLVVEAASAGLELWLRTVQRARQLVCERESEERGQEEGKTHVSSACSLAISSLRRSLRVEQGPSQSQLDRIKVQTKGKRATHASVLPALSAFILRACSSETPASALWRFCARARGRSSALRTLQRGRVESSRATHLVPPALVRRALLALVLPPTRERERLRRRAAAHELLRERRRQAAVVEDRLAEARVVQRVVRRLELGLGERRVVGFLGLVAAEREERLVPAGAVRRVSVLRRRGEQREREEGRTWSPCACPAGAPLPSQPSSRAWPSPAPCARRP